MKKLIRFAFILLTFMAYVGMFATAAELDHSISDERLAMLEKWMGDMVAVNPEITEEQLANAIEARFKALEPCLAEEKLPQLVLENNSNETAEQKLAAAALEEYPNYNMDELRVKSEEVYPLYKERQVVTVWFMKSPGKTDKIRGIYMGTHGGFVNVSSRKIRLGDMKGIECNEGPNGEIAKFDPVENQRLRLQWIDDYINNSAVNRKKFEDEHRAEFIAKQISDDFLANQRNGYIFWDGQWFTADMLLREYAEQTVQAARRLRIAQEIERVNRGNTEIAAQLEMTSQAYAIAPVGKLPNIKDVLEKQAADAAAAAAERQRLAEQQAKEEEERLEREAEEARLAELEAQRAAADNSKPAQPAVPTVEQASSKPLWLYVVIGIVVIGVIGFGAWMFFSHHEKELDVSKFYESTGEFQDSFWSAVDADPDHFKYVAYLFNTLDEAKEALCQLSFVGMGVNGELKSKRGDIILGAYNHQDRAVAVIGGVNLNYARWREASMVWPELPHASYFRQSSEPKVKLVMPSAEELSRQEGLSVEKLGAEDVRTESGEINRVFRYRCGSREDALKFLALFKVEEEGVVVRVKTAEGEFGKDINGVFTV